MSDRDEQSVSEEEIAEVRKWARVAWQTSRAPLRLIEKVDRLVAERDALRVVVSRLRRLRRGYREQIRSLTNGLRMWKAMAEQRITSLPIKNSLDTLLAENASLKAEVERLSIENRKTRDAADAWSREVERDRSDKPLLPLNEAVTTFFEEMARLGHDNYYTAHVDQDGRAWTLTLQRDDGLTPAIRIQELEAEVERLKADGERLEFWAKYPHRFGQTFNEDVGRFQWFDGDGKSDYCDDIRTVIDLARKAQGDAR